MSSFYSIPGPAGTIQVGTVTKLTPVSTPTVTNVGTAEAAILNFGIPQGDAGVVSAAGLGTAAAPSISFDADSNTGIYSPGADQVAISTGGAEHLRIDSAGNLLLGTTTANTTTRLQITAPVLSGAATPTLALNSCQRIYEFNHTFSAGQSIRIANTTSNTGHTSALFIIKYAFNRVVSNTATDHGFGHFAFRVLVLASGGVASIQGLTNIASYGFDPATNFTFTDNGSGSWHIQFDNISGDSTAASIQMEVLHGNPDAALYQFNDPFTSLVV